MESISKMPSATCPVPKTPELDPLRKCRDQIMARRPRQSWVVVIPRQGSPESHISQANRHGGRGARIITSSKVPEEYTFLVNECLSRGCICSCRIQLGRGSQPPFYRRQDGQNIRWLKRILRDDDFAKNPYLKWNRHELGTALIQRNIALPKNKTRLDLRTALEDADKIRQFRFMNLPIDIRMRIYKEVLHTDMDIYLSTNCCSGLNPSLLSVSHQIRNEATEVFFRTNRFQLRLIPKLYMFLYPRNTPICIDLWRLKRIGSEHISNLRHLSFSVIDNFYSNTVEIDLCYSDVENWIFYGNHRRPLYPRMRHNHNHCEDINRRLLIDRVDWWVDLPLGDSQWTKGKAKKYLADARAAVAQFVELCGTGKSVRPTVKGIELLACAIGQLCA